MDANQEFKNNFNISNQDKCGNKEIILDELSSNILDTINIIIQESCFLFRKNREDFSYEEKGKNIQINMDYLTYLKNSVNIISDIKYDKILCFKDLVTNLEKVYEKMKYLRIKGCSLPIFISIRVHYPKIIYNLDKKEVVFEDIDKFLFKVKNEYDNQLNLVYKNEKYIRFLYGKLFSKIINHFESGCEISELIRYILNITDNDFQIQNDYSYNLIEEDYIQNYSNYINSTFDFISKYIYSLFNNNNLDLDKHYEKILIKEKKEYKGIYLEKCVGISIEEFIIYLFYEELGQMPIAQNILFCNKETSNEEIESFLFRAILCDYNTLFIISIKESFSNYQYNNMKNYLNNILSYKLEKYKKENKNIDILNTEKYLTSCVVFILDKNLENNHFIYELEKYSNQNIKFDYSNNREDIILNNTILKNIKVISSDICGLGKSFKIKKMIKEENKRYYHFSLGGFLTKNIIYEKILDLFKNIEMDIKNNKNNLNYKDIALHIDLMETDETFLINEFLFSFLITKFYCNNEEIIHIPDNISIYIEIPNCFFNYLSKLSILNIFHIENIVQGELKKSEKKNVINISIPKLELEQKIIDIFERLCGYKTNEEIELFIKNNLGIKEYSYYQVHIFIKLFISQFYLLEKKIKFVDANGYDITNKCINFFKEFTTYFTNGEFPKLLTRKDIENYSRDIYDLLLDTYENDLKNTQFKCPLLFVDKTSEKYNLLYLQNTNNKIYKDNNKVMDIVFLVDSTGGMTYMIRAICENVINIFYELKEIFNLDFKFGAVFYRDKVDCSYEKNEYFPLTYDIINLKKQISNIYGDGGGDMPEDWVEGYKLALNQMNWRNGYKLIIHIADYGAHGWEFSKYDRHPEEGPKLYPLIKECVNKNINIIGFKVRKDSEQSFEKIKEIYNKHKLTVEDKGQFIDIYDFFFSKYDREIIRPNFYKSVVEAVTETVNPSYRYLMQLKKMLNLDIDIKKGYDLRENLLIPLISIFNYKNDINIITDDIYKKMILLIHRIKANIPVIIMGELECGKIAIIKKLYQLINKGITLNDSENLIQMDSYMTDKELYENMIKINNLAKKQKEEFWIIFDKINTCLSFTLLTEIFINRTFNGKKLEDNIRLIGGCLPYRKRKLTEYLSQENEKDNILIYNVKLLPQSLLYYIFSFGSRIPEDEKRYIYFMIGNLFNEEEKKLHELTMETISQCFEFLREIFNDPSIVTINEISKFAKCVEFFQDYYIIKNNDSKNEINEDKKIVNKIKSIVCSIYICYYLKLKTKEKRNEFDYYIKKILFQLINVYSREKCDEDKEVFLNNIKYKPLYEDIKGKQFNNFSDFLKLEKEFLINQIDINIDIGQNEKLKENIFITFFSIMTKIPLIIIGKPSDSKNLIIQLIINSLKGENTKNIIIKKYSKIIPIYFKCSKYTTSEDIEKFYNQIKERYINYMENNKNKENLKHYYIIIFEKLELIELSKNKNIDALNNILQFTEKNEGICFIGFSNYSFDSTNINQGFCFTVANIENILEETKNISESNLQ